MCIFTWHLWKLWSNIHFIVLIMAVSLLFLNIRSYTTHKLLFEQLLLEERIDVFALNETAFTPTQPVSCPRYNLLRCDNKLGTRAHGGAAIGLLHRLPYRRKLPYISADLPEHVFVSIYFPSIIINFSTIYVRPGHPIPYNYFQYIARNYRNIVIMADVNIHSRPQYEKDEFQEQQTALQLHHHHLPQHTRPCSQTTPDVIITSLNLLKFCAIQVLDNIGSDHVPVKLQLTTHRCSDGHTIPIRTVWRYDKANWEAYRQDMTMYLQHERTPNTTEDLCTSLPSLTTAIRSCAQRYIPTSQVRPHQPQLPPQYLALIKNSRRHFRDYLRTRNEDALQLHR